MPGPKKPSANVIGKSVNGLFVGHAAHVMADFPDNSVNLVITSPPYWTAVEYDSGDSPWASYGAYLDDIQAIWKACARVLRPNGKLCINAPLMRTKSLVVAFIAITVLSIPSAQAQVGCIGHRFSFKRDGITYVAGSTRAGQPCQMAFGIGGSDIEVVRTVVKPSHGVLGSSAKEGNRRYVAYAPSPGFVGRDRFEVYVQFTPLGGGSYSTIVKVEMNVVP